MEASGDIEPPAGVRQVHLAGPIQRFIRTEAAGGVVLMVGALIA